MEKLPQPIGTIVFNQTDQAMVPTQPTTSLASTEVKVYGVIAENVTDLSQADKEQVKRFSQAWHAANLTHGADVLHQSLTVRGNTIIAEQKTGPLSELGNPYQVIQETPGYFGIASNSTASFGGTKLLESSEVQNTQTLVVSSQAVQVWEVIQTKPDVIRIIGFEDKEPELLAEPAPEVKSPFDLETQALFKAH